MEFQVGETHSGYEFLDVLKRSKNGIEFRVKNTLAGRIEALRAIPEGSQNDREHAERFLREMRLHAGLVHPNIVTLFNAAELENQLVITTELVEGITVAERLLQGPLSWVDSIAVTRQILSAVGYAHRQGIIHRNISPENIIIGSGGFVKLANFALAKGANSPRLTQVGVAIGNLKYISPEQIKGIGDVDGRSDLYSLGMVLYEMLCGRPAFVMESEFELMAAQVGTTPISPEVVNSQVPRELGPVLLKALAKNPADRFQTAAEFDEALVKVSEGLKGVPAGTPAMAAPPVAMPVSPPMAPVTAAETRWHPQPPGIHDEGVRAGMFHTLEEPHVKPLVPSLDAVAATPMLSGRQIFIASAAGACTGVLMAVIWLITK